MALLTSGIVFSYKDGSTWNEIEGLLSTPDMGGSAEKIDVTTLKDKSKKYIKGLIDYSDLTFGFLYDNSSDTAAYRVFRQLEDSEKLYDFKMELPDGTSFEFTGEVTTSLKGASVSARHEFTVTITLNSEIVVTNP